MLRLIDRDAQQSLAADAQLACLSCGAQIWRLFVRAAEGPRWIASLMYGHDPDIEAKITFLKTDEGGRKGYVVSGYRPQFFYHGEDHDAIQEFVDKERVHPGETVTVRLSLLAPQLLCDHIRVNDCFEIREGRKTVGRGKITRILKLSENAAASNR